ncbi:MAG TPA: hypothetical protein DCX65_13180 [Spirochaetaceae bacterium]|nr:hypothetical protein [Spirochaetaceae bacterium]
MNGERLVAALEAVRRRLQRQAWLARLAAWCGSVSLAGAVVAGLFVASGLADPWPAVGLVLAAGGLAAGAAAWWTLRRPVTLELAAGWIDRALGRQGLFSSSLLCVQRQYKPEHGDYDEAVIQAAERRLPGIEALAIPRRFWVRPLLLAAAGLLAVGALVLLPWSGGVVPAGSWTMPGFSQPEATPVQVAAAVAEVSAALPSVDPSATPEELATAMFPDKPELARLLAAALRAGRLEEVRELVDRATLAQANLAESRGSEASNPDTSDEMAGEKPENSTRVEADGEAAEGSTVERTGGQEGGTGDEQDDSPYQGEATPMAAPPGQMPSPGTLSAALLNRPRGAGASSGGDDGDEAGDEGDGSGQDDPAGGADADGEAGDQEKGPAFFTQQVVQ